MSFLLHRAREGPYGKLERGMSSRPGLIELWGAFAQTRAQKLSIAKRQPITEKVTPVQHKLSSLTAGPVPPGEFESPFPP